MVPESRESRPSFTPNGRHDGAFNAGAQRKVDAPAALFSVDVHDNFAITRRQLDGLHENDIGGTDLSQFQCSLANLELQLNLCRMTGRGKGYRHGSWAR